MTKHAEAILKEALELEPDERAELIHLLARSFEQTTDDRIDALAAEEAESRIEAYDAGKLTADSAEAVFERLNRR
jgi:putative addiction module component (TIGR02574 family)